MKRRDVGIDFLMFVAVLMVVNSHLEDMYVGCFKPLATGGVLGDALFFFCSGYKLFLGRMDRFDNWYKRRIVRIYPSIIVWDVIAASVLPLPLTPLTLFDGWCPTGGYWFVKCIMVHYVAIYIIRKFFFDHLKLMSNPEVKKESRIYNKKNKDTFNLAEDTVNKSVWRGRGKRGNGYGFGRGRGNYRGGYNNYQKNNQKINYGGYDNNNKFNMNMNYQNYQGLNYYNNRGIGIGRGRGRGRGIRGGYKSNYFLENNHLNNLLLNLSQNKLSNNFV